MEIDDAFQGEVFVFRIHEVVDVIDVLGTLVARADNDFAVVVQVFLGNALDFAAHRGREHQRVALRGQLLENFVDALRKTHVEHFVGFVEHHASHVAQVGLLAVHEVDESAWRGHDNLRTVLERANLLHHRRAAIDRHDVNPRNIFREVFQVVADLQAELARGAQNERLRLAAVGVERLQERNAEGRRLARTRLSEGNEV